MLVYEAIKNDPNTTPEKIAKSSGISLSIIKKEIKRLIGNKLITKTSNGYVILPDFSESKPDILKNCISTYIVLASNRDKFSTGLVSQRIRILNYKISKRTKFFVDFIEKCVKKEADPIMVIASMFFSLDINYCNKTYKTPYPPLNILNSSVIWVWYNQYQNYIIQTTNMESKSSDALLLKDYKIWESLGCPKSQNIINMFQSNGILSNNFNLKEVQEWQTKRNKNH